MVVSAQPLGSVSKDDDEGSDNVVKKMICLLSNFIAPFWTPKNALIRHSTCDLKTRGVNVPCSMSITLSAYAYSHSHASCRSA